MKIQTILNEDFAPAAKPRGILFSDLNTLQVRTLQRLANGEVDVDNASDNEYDIMSDLAELGLLDQDYALTQLGSKAVAIAKKLGGSAELLAARKRQEKLGAIDKDEKAMAADVQADMNGPGYNGAPSLPDEVDAEDDEFDFDLDQKQSPRGRLNF